MVFEPWNEERAGAIIAGFGTRRDALLPMLQAVRACFGHIPDDAIRMAAEAVNITRAEAFGVVTFYHDLNREKPGRHVLRLCRAEACQARGGDALAERAQEKLGIFMGSTSADGAVTLEPVYCLGLCAAAPSAMLDGRVVGRLDAKRLDGLLAECAT